MFLIVFYSKLLLYNDLGGYNAESLNGVPWKMCNKCVWLYHGWKSAGDKRIGESRPFFKRHGGNHDIYSNAELKCSIPLKRHSFNKNDLRYILKEIEQRAKKWNILILRFLRKKPVPCMLVYLTSKVVSRPVRIYKTQSTTPTQASGYVVLIRWLQSALIPFVTTQASGY